MDNMMESTIIIKLMTLQQRYNPIHLIITDMGSNLRNLATEGQTKFSGEPLRLFTMLKKAWNSGVFNQRANLVEGSIKKLKTATRTISGSYFKKLIQNFKTDQFELLMAYVKSSIESCPYGQATGTLCPKDIRGTGILAPLELLITPEKEVFLDANRQNMAKALNLAVKDIRTGQEAKNNIFYNYVGVNSINQPKINDLVLVRIQKDIGKVNKLGRVTKIGKSTLKVTFPNGHENKYDADRVVFVFRPPLQTPDHTPPQPQLAIKSD